MKYLLLFMITLGGFLYWQRETREDTPSLENNIPRNESNVESTEIIADNLDIPWSFAFLPDNSILITERPGRIVHIHHDKTKAIYPVEGVLHRGESGLLGLALHPEFNQNRYIYLYYTVSEDNNQTINQVVRYTFTPTRLEDPQTILSRIPGARNHNGGRIAFGPDGLLYIGTGDAQYPSLSQDTSSLAGKILRVTDTGKPAPGNPYQNEVYSYGHRNVQGLSWDNNRQLWATEHGQRGNDEINLIQPGNNYGWPLIEGSEAQNSLITPRIHSGTDTWAPSGLAHSNNKLYIAGLRGEALYTYSIETNSINALYKHTYGRIRDVMIMGDYVYFLTSNRDGRGTPQIDDDKLIRTRMVLP